jgi:hypothetical protein
MMLLALVLWLFGFRDRRDLRPRRSSHLGFEMLRFSTALLALARSAWGLTCFGTHGRGGCFARPCMDFNRRATVFAATLRLSPPGGFRFPALHSRRPTFWRRSAAIGVHHLFFHLAAQSPEGMQLAAVCFVGPRITATNSFANGFLSGTI